MSFGFPLRNGAPVGLASVAGFGKRVAAFSPASLFTGGVQGVWYDPSDYTTLFQNSAGTTPVTAVEQPVGLMLDKSQGLVLGSEATSGAWLNGFTTTFDTFTSTGPSSFTATTTGAKLPRASVLANLPAAGWYWIEFTATFTGGSISAVGLGNTASPYSSAVLTTVLPATGVAFRTLIYTSAAREYLNITFNATGASTLSVSGVSVKELPGNHASQATSTSRPVLRARKNWLVSTNTLATQTVTTRAIPYVLSFYGTGSITLSGTATGTLNGTGVNNRVYVDVTPTAGTLTVTVTGTVTNAQLEFANEPA